MDEVDVSLSRHSAGVVEGGTGDELHHRVKSLERQIVLLRAQLELLAKILGAKI